MRITLLALTCLALAAPFVPGCRSADDNDQAVSEGVPPPTGKDFRIRDITDPTIATHSQYLNAIEPVSGAVVIAVDTYDETHNGKGTGTIYLEDLDTSKTTPWAGISLYQPTFTPGNLRVSNGDVLDMSGEYQESNTLGATVTFPMGTSLVQMYEPAVTFRFESQVPAPVIIDNPDDLNDYAKAGKWIGMLVQVNNVVTAAATYDASSGRSSVDMSAVGAGGTTSCSDGFPKSWQIVNDLMDIDPVGITKGQTIKSVTGILVFFCNIQLAPRSAADFKL